VEAKLDRELILELERYCEYLESDRDYVIAQALSVVFRKDKGFAAWQETHPVPQARTEGPVELRGSNTRSPK
jgi:hypothetical protein